ncbi:MAG: T9SS type A sorting domain-containing protein [bacterium]
MRKVFSLLFIASLLMMPLVVKAQPKLEECNNGLFGGCVSSLLVSKDTIFAGTTQNGLFKSIDKGVTWDSLKNELSEIQINCLTTNGKSMYAGTSAGCYISGNNGATWKIRKSGIFDNYNVNCILIDSSKNVFMGKSDGIFYLGDKSPSWVKVNNGLFNTSIKCLVKYKDMILAGSEGSGVFISTDYGANWTASFYHLTVCDIRCLAVSGNNIFAGSKGGGVFISTDDGGIWQEVNTGLTNLNIQTLKFIGTDLFAGTEDGLFISTNNGTSWNPYRNGLEGISVLGITENQNKLFVNTQYSGIFSLNANEETWNQCINGFPLVKVNCLASNTKFIYAGTLGNGVYVTSNNGTTWRPYNFGITHNYINCLAVSGDSIFAGTPISLLFSTENNNTWKTVYKCPSYNWVRKIFILGNDLYCCLEIEVLNTKRDELIWKQVMYKEVISMAKIDQKTFAGMQIQYGPKGIITGGGLFVKNNNDTLWEESGYKAKSVGNLLVNKSNLLIQSGNDFLTTTDLGFSWEPIKYIAPKSYTTLLVSNGKDLYLGTSGLDETPGMLLSSSDNGLSWKVIDTIPNKKFLKNMDLCGNYLYLNFSKDGMYRIDISDYVSVQDKPSAEEFSVYPNPAADFITVTLKPSEGSAINIYNTLGEMVLSVGTGRDLFVRINISDLPKGIYFVKVGVRTAKFVKI